MFQDASEELEEDDDEDEDDNNDHAERDELFLHDTACMPLYPGSTVTILNAVILILNCMRTYGALSALINEIFVLLHKVILPGVNGLPKSEYKASKMLRKLGLTYESIDVCPNECILFRGSNFRELERCPMWDASRRKRVGKSLVPRRVVRYFPIIPRIKCTFLSPLLAAALHKSLDRKMRSVADSPAWKRVDELYPEFASEARNLSFALATDGINPFSDKRSTYLVWPILLLN